MKSRMKDYECVGGDKPLFVVRLLSFALIGWSAFADYLTFNELFMELNCKPFEGMVLGLTLAVLLSGLPFYLGKAWAEYVNNTGCSSRKRTRNRVIIILTLIMMVVSIAVEGLLHAGYNEISYHFTAVNANGAKQFLEVLFRMCAPALTSLLIWVASYMAFLKNGAQNETCYKGGHSFEVAKRAKESSKCKNTGVIAFQLFSTVLIAFLSYSNFYCIRSLFQELDCTVTQQYIYSLTLVIVLEGSVFFLEEAWHNPKYSGHTCKKQGSRVLYVGLSLLIHLLANVILVSLRILWMRGCITLADVTYHEYDYMREMLVQMFMLLSPMLTCPMSIIVSVMSFRKNRTDISTECIDMVENAYDGER